MTDKHAKKLMTALSIPADKQEALIAASNDDTKEFDISDFLEGAKNYATPLVKPTIEKEARKEAATGVILKTLQGVYDGLKEENDDMPTFEEWKKTKDGVDYKVVITESIQASKIKGHTLDKTVQELQKKLDAQMKINQESTQTIEKVNKEWQSKLDERDLRDQLSQTFEKIELKPIDKDAYKYFLNDKKEEGIEIRLHEGKPAPFKKDETVPLQHEKTGAFITVDNLFTEWAEKKPGLFKQSAGNETQHKGGPLDTTIGGQKAVVDEKAGTVTYGSNRPIPIEK